MEILLNEHRVVEEILDGLCLAARAFRFDSVPPDREAGELVWFLRAFTDGCHHSKEEDILFPLLEGRYLNPNMGPTAAMRMDHRRGAFLIRDMAEGLDGWREGGGPESSRRRFVHAAEAYADLLRSHIRKEDHCVFALASALLEPSGMEALLAGFRRADAEFAVAGGGADFARAREALDIVARWKGGPSKAGRLLSPTPRR